MSNYETELNEWREVSRRFNNAKIAYRAGTITDAQFLEVRAAFDEASAKLDRAESEQNRVDDLAYESRQEQVERDQERGNGQGYLFR